MRRTVIQVIVFAVVAAFTATTARAQDVGRIAGRVTDKDKKPIVNAAVQIVGARISVRTDAQGAYQMDSVPAGVANPACAGCRIGTVNVRALAVGYKPMEVAGLRIVAGQTIVGFDFQMEPAQVTMHEIPAGYPAAGASSMLLRFQLIRPIATRTTDKVLMPIDSVLRDLFQWPGYQLLAQSALTLDFPMAIVWGGTGASTSTQTMLNVEGNAYDLSVRADTTEFAPQRVKLTVSLVGLSHAAATKSVITTPADRKTLLSTTVTVNLGRTVVLGSTQPGGGRGGMNGTLILTVSPAMAKPN